MPRCIFKLLWDTIQAGDEMFAYVKNLASDGAYYWVLAHVTPSFNGGGRIVGYHSNRRSPERAAVQELDALYRTLLAEEKRHSDPVEAMAASRDLLTTTLASKAMTYDEFVWDVINKAEAAA
jgi:hypothetical protein